MKHSYSTRKTCLVCRFMPYICKYKPDKDYFGFFPLPKEKYLIKGLERYDDIQLKQLAAEADVVYITDTYGIYSNEWFKINDPLDRSKILYGGMSPQDLTFIDQMRNNHKLIISEFNSIGSPTAAGIRKEFEDSFGIKWSGWVGRYFDELKSLPLDYIHLSIAAGAGTG